MNTTNFWLYTKPIAHRGLHNDIYPENTAPAFLNAIKNNYAIETDVQMTKDGVLVCYHDNNLTRGANIDKDIRDLNYKDIKDLKVFNSKNTILTFEEVLKLVDGKTPILIEAKTQKAKGIEQKILDLLKDYKGEFAIESFNPFIIKKMAKLEPKYYYGVLSTLEYFDKLTKLQNRYLHRLWYRFHVPFSFLSVRVCDLEKLYYKAKKYNVITWTVKSESDLKIAEKYAKNIIFENIKDLGKFQ